MEAQWRQGGRGRGRGRPGDELAARSGAAARPPAARGRGGARAAAAGTMGEGASGECRVLPSTRAAGARAGEPAGARSPCRWRGRGCPRHRGEGRLAGPGPAPALLGDVEPVFAMCPARRFLPGRETQASSSGEEQGAKPSPGCTVFFSELKSKV